MSQAALSQVTNRALAAPIWFRAAIQQHCEDSAVLKLRRQCRRNRFGLPEDHRPLATRTSRLRAYQTVTGGYIEERIAELD
jgi:hypothetical protein